MGHTHSVPHPPSATIEKTFNFLTPLYESCRDGNEEQVRKLLPNYSHENLNQQEHINGGNTCLHIAAANGRDNIVKILLQKGCYRSALLNSQNQSAYDLAASSKESTRLLFLRLDENDPSLKPSSRFYEQNASECFDIVKHDVKQETDSKPRLRERRSSIEAYKTEEEIKHELEYSACSKALCQSHLGCLCVNALHNDEPLNHHTIIEHLNNLLEHSDTNKSNDYIKADDLIKQYARNFHSIEHLLHLYTLETRFYKTLKQDCLPLAIPLFMHLQKVKHRYFKGRAYRGIHMSPEQLLTYEMAMDTPGTLLQTRAFSSTSMERHVAEEFAYVKAKTNEKDLCVLFIFDFPNACDQAINLSRISSDV